MIIRHVWTVQFLFQFPLFPFTLFSISFLVSLLSCYFMGYFFHRRSSPWHNRPLFFASLSDCESIADVDMVCYFTVHRISCLINLKEIWRGSPEQGNRHIWQDAHWHKFLQNPWVLRFKWDILQFLRLHWAESDSLKVNMWVICYHLKRLLIICIIFASFSISYPQFGQHCLLQLCSFPQPVHFVAFAFSNSFPQSGHFTGSPPTLSAKCL